MIDIKAVRAHLKVLGGYSESRMEDFALLIEHAAETVTRQLPDGTDASDTRLVHLAAVKALCMIENADFFGDGVSVFKAGDITVEKSSAGTESLKQLLEEAEKDCRDLLCDSAFAFLDV